MPHPTMPHPTMPHPTMPHPPTMKKAVVGKAMLQKHVRDDARKKAMAAGWKKAMMQRYGLCAKRKTRKEIADCFLREYARKAKARMVRRRHPLHKKATNLVAQAL